MERTPTVYDVAERAGVSIATVSRVLRRPEVVREQTRQQVLDAVEALGYLPSGSARGLASRRTGVLGLLLPSHDQPREAWATEMPADGRIELVLDERHDDHGPHNLYYDEVLLGAESEAWAEGFALMVTAGGDGHHLEVQDFAGRVDGLVAVANAVPESVLRHVGRRIPIALIAEHHDERSFDQVSAGNREGMLALVRHLVDAHGVRRIAFVTGPEGSPDAAERLAGMREAAAGLDVQLIDGDFTRQSGRDAAAALDPDELPHAVVCANDQSALGVLDGFARRDIHVPDDVIVTGFDGIDAASTAGLTTVRQPMAGLGTSAVRLLIERISGVRDEPTSLRLAVKVILRSSCGCRPGLQARPA
jgi:LacI family transcriptional regulator